MLQDVFGIVLWLLTSWWLLAPVSLLTLWLVINAMAKNDFFIGLVQEGDMRFVVKGENLARIILNAKDYHLDKKGIVTKNEEVPGYKRIQAWYDKMLGVFGFYWIGIPPTWHMHEYEFEYGRKVEDDLFGVKLTSDTLKNLHLAHTYQVVAKNVLLKDSFRIEVSFNLVVRAYDPTKAIFVLKGKWWTPLTSAVLGAIADEVNNYSYAQWLAMDKLAKNKSKELSAFVKAVEAINDLLQRDTGMTVESIQYSGFKLSDKQDEAVAATQAMELAQLKGRALLWEAKNKAKITKAEGDASNQVALDRWAAVGRDVLIAEAGAKSVENFRPEQPGAVLTLGGQGPVPTYQVGNGGGQPARAPAPVQTKKKSNPGKGGPAKTTNPGPTTGP